MSTPIIAIATTEAEIEACYPVMAELRPHLSQALFMTMARRMAKTTGFRLAYLDEDGVKAVAGFRLSEWLAGGVYLEIEDLVTSDGFRSKAYGGALFDWLLAFAKAQGCDHLRLFSGVQRKDAHRFYLRKGMELQAYYFSIPTSA